MHIQLKLSSNPSKQEEIDCYKKFVDSLPSDSYLIGILKNTQYDVERLIRSDFILPLVGAEKVASLENENERLIQEKSFLQHQLKNLQFNIPYKYKRALQRFRRSYKKLAHSYQCEKNSSDSWFKDWQEMREQNENLTSKLEFQDTNLFN